MQSEMFSLASLPYVVAYFLGYRRSDKKPHKRLPQWRVCFWSFLGAWLGIAILEVVFTYGPAFINVPMLIGSFGASAVLLFGVIDSPLAQPRNAFCGQIIGALCGVIISQLFTQVPKHWASEEQALAVKWIAGATAMALSLLVMQLTKTVHPPGGATAVIAVTQSEASVLGWYYIAVVVISVTLHIAIACIVNNIERRYPMYWWSPKASPIPSDPPAEPPSVNMTPVPSLDCTRRDFIAMEVDAKDNSSALAMAHGDIEDDLATLRCRVQQGNQSMVIVTPERLLLPTNEVLTEEEIDFLKILQMKLRD